MSHPLEGVLVVDVARGSRAWGTVRAGDVIQSVSRKPVKDPEGARTVLKESFNKMKARPILMMINRDGGKAFVAINTPEKS